MRMLSADIREHRLRLGGRHRVIDARGCAIPLCTPEQLSGDAAPELRRAVQNANNHRWWRVLRPCLVLVAGLVLYDVLVGRAPVATRAVDAAVLFALCLALKLVDESIRAGKRGEAAVAALRRAGLCPACCYDVRGLPRTREGCVLCPECDAAWRVA